MTRRIGQRENRRGLPRAAAGASIDLPIQLGLYSWLRADRGIVASAGSVDSWGSLGSLATSFANTGTARPTFIASNPALNGQPTVRFTAASSQYLVSAAPALTTALAGGAYTCFVVHDRASSALTQTVWALGNTGVAMETHSHLRLATGVDSLFIRNAAGNTQNTGIRDDGALPTLYVATYSGSLFNTWTNALPSVVAGSNGRLVICDQFYLATQRYNGANGAFFDGDIAELIIYGAVLSPEDIAYTTAYLKTRYALAAVPGLERADLGLVAGFEADSAYVTDDGTSHGSTWTARWSYDLAGTPVAPWTIQQPTPAARPLIEAAGFLGKPSLYFTTDDFFVTPDDVLAGLLDGAQPITIYAAIDRDTESATTDAICCFGASGTAQTYITFRTDNVVTPGTDLGDRIAAGSTQGAGRGTAPVGIDPVILTHQWDGANMRGWRGATLSYTKPSGVQPICDRLYVGMQRHNGSNGAFMRGRMAMLLFFRVAHNAEQQAYVRGLLRSMYPGLTLTSP